MRVARILALVLILSSTACSWANFHSVHREFTLGDREGRADSLDAKQRIVISKQFTPKAGDRVVSCGEPSPDALQALSTALAASVTTPQQVSAGFSGSTAESVMNIGLRTQSIQLMRDGMFRICEGYFNGALNAPEYRHFHLRYRDSMVALLAIEQLTGAVRPQLYSVGASGSAAVTSSASSTSTSSTTTTTTGGSPAPTVSTISDKAAQYVSSAIAKIVKETLDKDYEEEYCLSYFNSSTRSDETTAFCKARLCETLEGERRSCSVFEAQTAKEE